MRIILAVLGVIIALFLVPLFMQLRDMLLFPLFDEHITNPHLWLFYTALPYVVVGAIFVLIFLAVRGRTQHD